MFKRALLRQSQAAKAAFSAHPMSTVSLAQRATAPIRSHQIKPLPVRSWQRYSSTEAEGEKKEGEAAPAAEEKAQEKPEEALSKELEAKNKEIVDIKVRYCRSVSQLGEILSAH